MMPETGCEDLDILSGTQVEALRAVLGRAHNAVVTCHVSPDGDALGGALAAASFLRRLGVHADVIIPNRFPDFLNFLPGAGDVVDYEAHQPQADEIIRKADLIVCLDFNDMRRLLSMETPVMESKAPRILVDHHLVPSLQTPDSGTSFKDEWAWALSCPSMSSTCELLYHVFSEVSGLESITCDEASCLFTGILTDTGCFAYNASRPALFRAASALLSKGIDKDFIYHNVFHNYSVQRFRLLGYILYVKMEYFPQYHAALITMTRAEQKKFAHKKGDTEGFVNIPLQIRSTRLSIFLREDTERPSIRVSLRSTDTFPCNEMAEEFFHGGGHRNASGGELFCTMDDAIQTVKKALAKYAPLLEPTIR